ncbi:MAG: hypothetical protein ACRDXX_00340 [Stackebrandtia sp.]
MRHIGSLVAGIIFAPVAWLLIGAAEIGLNTSVFPDAVGAPDKPIAMGMFAGAGLLLGLLAVTRWSPAGPLAAAAVFGGGFAIFRVMGGNVTLPSSLEAAKIPADSVMVAGDSGWGIAIAVLMFMSVVIPGRWRGKKKEEEDRVVDAASLSGDPGATKTLESDAFTSTPTDNGSGFGTRPVNPFDAPPPMPPQHPDDQTQPDTRSPYAEDGYTPRAADAFDNYGSRFNSEQPQTGSGQYGDQRQPGGYFR